MISIWTIIIVGGIAFLLLSSFGKNLLKDFKMPNIPFLNPSNTTENNASEPNPLPEPVQKGVDFLGESYSIPLWLLVLIGLGLVWIAKR